MAGKDMTHAGKRWALHAAIMMVCSTVTVGGVAPWAMLRAHAAVVEPTIVPTVHATLAPSSAIPVPLVIRGDTTSVWRSDLEQRMLINGHVVIEVGYRSLRADSAALWLTPSRESGESTYDVTIYLAGNVSLAEGDRSTSTMSTGKELLVTTRISRSVQLAGTPASKAEEESPIVKRGDDLRYELANRPIAPAFIPRIVITPAEDALQAGWIARGPNNRFVAGPGDVQIVRGPGGERIVLPSAATKPKPEKPHPQSFIAGDDARPTQVGNEWITVITNPYMLYDALDGKPPIEFHAQRMVVFSPMQKGEAAGGEGPGGRISRFVTGVYLEGDVSIDSGDQMHVKASRIYYDFTSQRAIMLDATLSTVDEIRKVPLYMRAAQIRQLSRSEYAAKQASFSTSEFHTPHYQIGASDVYLQNISAPELQGRELQTYAFKVKDATIDVEGVPIFYWPYLAGDTSKNVIPLRRLKVGNSSTYGLTLETTWDLFALAGQKEPTGMRADLYLDYFEKRGPAGGVDSKWTGDDYNGLLRSYIMQDKSGTDNLGFNRDNVPVEQEQRGRIIARHKMDLGDGWQLAVEGAYISDPNFLEQFFSNEFNSDKEPETSVYLKKQGETDALTFLGKFTLLDFTASADQVDDQYTTEKKPEVKYWRIGDSFFDMLTYYSESGLANVHTMITNYTPTQLGLMPSFLGPPAAVVPLNSTYRSFYQHLGYTDQDVFRSDSRHEVDLPLQLGDVKVVPYMTGRVTHWTDAFPEDQSGDTTRLWGQAGMRSSMEFWRVYDDVNSTFWDVHRLRHLIEPQFNVFETGASEQRADLQQFDHDVEGISKASGTSVAVNQKWQTKRGGEGHWRNVDWVVLNVQWNKFWDKDQPGLFFPLDPLRGFYNPSRPELSLVRDSIAADAVWRMGERARILGEMNYNTDDWRLEQLALGLVIDQTDNLSYFFGNRYIRELGTDEWTIAADYHLSRKYEIIAAESYDFGIGNNILSSLTIVRKLPRFNTGITVTYDANQSDTTVVFTAWPEGFPEVGFGNRGGSGAGATSTGK